MATIKQLTKSPQFAATLAKIAAAAKSQNAATTSSSKPVTLESRWKEADNAYNSWLARESELTDPYLSDVNKLFDSIMNQKEFSYDPAQDQLFQMYKQQYNQQGTRAMQNAMGVGVARSGGYNSSAAQTAAQTTYGSYLNALNDKVADTYQNALDMWKYNQQNTINRFNMARDMNESANNRYYTQAGLLSQKANNLWGMYNNDRQFNWQKESDNRLFNFQKEQADIANTQWKKQFELSQKEYQLNKKLYKGK